MGYFIYLIYCSIAFLIHHYDISGHVNFADEVTAAIRVADGALLVVDVLEGVMANTEKIIKQLITENVPITLVLNKVDRLILELKLPPLDAYFKLKYTIEEVNAAIAAANGDYRVSPELGNVCFASSMMGWVFSLNSFSKMYASKSEEGFDVTEFSKRLWGDVYFDPERGSFRRKPTDAAPSRTFVHFILEPLYKIYSQVIGEEMETLKETLSELGIYLKPSILSMDVKPLIRIICESFFGDVSGLVDMLVHSLPSPVDNADMKTEHIYTGELGESPYSLGMKACDSTAPLMIQIVKLYNSTDMGSFEAFGRVLSGTITLGQQVRVLGESYSPDDEEDMAVQTVESLSIYESRYKIKINSVGAGGWVLIGGVDASIMKTATITDTKVDDMYPVHILTPLHFNTEPVLKVAVEPINPTDLPKMLDGLRKINKSYPLVRTKVEESGEHIILGTGELYLDCVLHDLRKLYAEIEVKVSDPVVKFCETVVETSSLKCFAESPNKK